MSFSNSQKLALLGLVVFRIEKTGFSTLQTSRSKSDLSPILLLGVLSMCDFVIEPNGLKRPGRNTQQTQFAQPVETNTAPLAVVIDQTENRVHLSSIESQLKSQKRGSKPNIPVEQLLYGTPLRSHSSRMLLELFGRPMFSQAYSEFYADALEHYCQDDSNWMTFETLDAQIAVVRNSLVRDAVTKRPRNTMNTPAFLYQSQRRFVILITFTIKKWVCSRKRDAWFQILTEDGIIRAAWQVSFWLKAIHAFQKVDPYSKKYFEILAPFRAKLGSVEPAIAPFQFTPAYEDFHHALLASWGLNSNHEGICLLLSETWSEPPRTIADRFEAARETEYAKPITSATLRLWAKAGDLDFGATQREGTALRAYSILRSWANGAFKRSVLEDEEPLDSGLDGSHLCHERLCVLHLIQEPRKYNMDRQNCHKDAINRRRNGEYLPVSCSGAKCEHLPPCKLQVNLQEHGIYNIAPC